MGIWGDQIDDLMAEASAHWDTGNLMALQALESAILRWWRQSPCPNAVMVALEYVRAALDTVTPMPHPGTIELVAVEDVRKRWGSVDREKLAAKTGRSDNWMYE